MTPNSLSTTSLQNVCHLITDGKHGDCQSQENSGYYFLSAKDVRDGKLIYKNSRQITKDDFLQTHRRTQLEHLDILIVSTGATIGRMAIAPDNELISRTTFQKSVAILKPNKELVSPYWLYYKLNQDKDLLVNMSGGTAQGNLLLRDLRAFKIKIPPLPTQRRIADILSAYDDLIEVNMRRIRILEGMAQSLYHEMFVVETLPATSPLPAGWGMKELGDIAQEVRRSIQPSEIDPETPYFGLEHLPRQSLALSEWGKASDVQSTKLAFKKGEILFGKIRPYFHKVGVAPLDGVASSDTIIIVPKSPEYFGLVLSCVFSEDFVNQATLTSQGTKMPRANWNVLVKYPIALPPKPMLEKFNDSIQDIVDLLTVLLFQNRNLRKTRDLLLPRLVGGEVPVNGW